MAGLMLAPDHVWWLEPCKVIARLLELESIAVFRCSSCFNSLHSWSNDMPALCRMCQLLQRRHPCQGYRILLKRSSKADAIWQLQLSRYTIAEVTLDILDGTAKFQMDAWGVDIPVKFYRMVTCPRCVRTWYTTFYALMHHLRGCVALLLGH